MLVDGPRDPRSASAMLASARWGWVVLALAACAPKSPPPVESQPNTCTTLADCDAKDGARVAVVGVYRFYPDPPGVDTSGAPRAVRLQLTDGVGPFLDPFWSARAIRPVPEVEQFLGKRVRVTGIYHKDMPINPDDPPQASRMGGPCLEVERIEAER